MVTITTEIKIFIIFVIGGLLLIVVSYFILPDFARPVVLPINGVPAFVTVSDVRTIHVAGYPPCLEYYDYDCITDYEDQIVAPNKDIYFMKGLHKTKYPVQRDYIIGKTYAITCESLGGNSKHDPDPSWCCTIDDRDTFWGCRIIWGA